MRSNKEYQVCKAIATYLKYQHPNVIFRFDMAGLCLTKAQAGMNKAIQYGKGYPDLFIAEKRNHYSGMFLEIKAEGVKTLNKLGNYSTPHIEEQYKMLSALKKQGYEAQMVVGFDEAKEWIDIYMGR